MNVVDMVTERILLIEDNLGDADLIRFMLEEAGEYILTHASRLEAGIEVAQQQNIDLILLDLNLPDSQGFPTLERALKSIPAIPIIVLTGMPDRALGLKAVSKGAQDYLVKGDFNVDLLGRAIRYAVERHHLGQARREQEAQFQTLTNNSLAGIYIIQDGLFQYANPALGQIFGVPPDELVGKLGQLDFVCAEDAELVRRNVERRLSGEVDAVHYMYRIERKDGERRYCEVLGRRIEYRDRPALMGTVLDITEQRRAQEASEENQRKLVTLMSNLPGMAFRCRNVHSWTMEYISEGCAQLTGYAPEDLIEDRIVTYGEIIHPDDREMVWQAVQTALSAHRTYEIEYRITCRDESIRWVWERGQQVASENGVAILEGFCSDITARKEAETDLANEQSLLRTLIDNIPDYIYVKDPESRFLLANNILAHDFGVSSPRELLGKTDADFLSTPLASQYRHDEKTIVETGEALVGREEQIVLPKDGTTRWILTTKVPIHNPVGEITRIVGIGRDITRRKHDENALRLSAERLRQTGRLAHVGGWEVDVPTQRLTWTEETYNIHDSNPNYVPTLADAIAFYTEDCQPRIREAVNTLMRTGKRYDLELQIITAKGQYRWIRTIGEAEYQEGEIIRIYGAIQDITERKRMEDTLVELLRFNRESLDSLSAHIAVIDATGRIINVNEAWRQFARANNADLDVVCEGANYITICQTALDSPDAASARSVLDGLNRVLYTNQELIVSEYTCHSPEEARWFEVRLTRFSGEGLQRVVIAHENVTERKTAQIALENRNEHLRLLNRIIALASLSLQIEEVLLFVIQELARSFNIPIAFAVLCDEQGQHATVVTEYLQDGGPSVVGKEMTLSEESILNKSLKYNIPMAADEGEQEDLFSQLHNIANLHPLKSVMVVPFKVQYRLQGVMLLVGSEPQMFNEDNIILAAEITQPTIQALEYSLLQAQLKEHNTHLEKLVNERTQQLRRINQRMAAILNNTSDAIVLLQETGNIEVTNPAFDRQFGYEPDELFDQPISIVTIEEHYDLLTQTVHNTLAGIEADRKQIAARRKDGSTFDVEVTFARVPNNENHVVCNLHDITHFKEIERIKDDFVSMVSHELRTPIASLMLISDSLQKYYIRMDENMRLNKINQIHTQSQVLADLVSTILDISRLEARQGRLGTEIIDMKMVFDDVIHELRPSAEAKRQTLMIERDTNVGKVIGDSVDFSRIWRNLINNAVKYTPDGGTIRVKLLAFEANGKNTPELSADFDHKHVLQQLQSGHYIIGQVEDTGHGIHPNDFDNLFTRFHRGWAKQSGIPGTGLGLALVRELLIAYGGDIHVTSELEVGTMFTFWIPVHKQAAHDNRISHSGESNTL